MKRLFKNITAILATVALVFGSNGCQEDFLDTTPSTASQVPMYGKVLSTVQLPEFITHFTEIFQNYDSGSSEFLPTHTQVMDIVQTGRTASSAGCLHQMATWLLTSNIIIPSYTERTT